MAEVTYGRLVHADYPQRDPLQRQSVWGMQARPHVMIRAKRWFPRAEQDRRGTLILRDTPEVARDLECFIARFPLEMTDEAAGLLAGRAEQHRRSEQIVTDILGGYSPPDDWKPPARPARDYQQQAADLVHATGRLLLADDLGLGKTMTSLLVLRDPEALPALIVVPTHLPRQWLRELNATLPWLCGHIVTKAQPYDPARLRGARPRRADHVVFEAVGLGGPPCR